MMHHGENVLMVLDQDSNEIRYLVETNVPLQREILSKSRTHLFSFNSPKGACDHCNGLGTNEINVKKNYS
jgi:excinuclease ABC subunit A